MCPLGDEPNVISARGDIGRIAKESGGSPGQVPMSRDPKFIDKLVDIVGLYLNPPDKALVLCVDEKSQIQALDRTQPGLPMKPGRLRDHDA